MKTFAFVFARGGSKGLPKKNLKKIEGKTLLQHSVDTAKQIKEIKEIYVSTEDSSIKKEAIKLNVNIIPRPKDLAKDNSDEWKAWQHAVKYLKKRNESFDVFVSIPATSPLRKVEDIKACIAALDTGVDSVIVVTESARSPWFNMIKRKENGDSELVNKNKNIYRRQDAPKTYDLTTVAYVTRPNFILSAKGVFDGNCKSIVIPKERSIDIDDIYDYELAKFLFSKRKRNL